MVTAAIRARSVEGYEYGILNFNYTFSLVRQIDRSYNDIPPDEKHIWSHLFYIQPGKPCTSNHSRNTQSDEIPLNSTVSDICNVLKQCLKP